MAMAAVPKSEIGSSEYSLPVFQFQEAMSPLARAIKARLGTHDTVHTAATSDGSLARFRRTQRESRFHATTLRSLLLVSAT
jgi:hypothetical protein